MDNLWLLTEERPKSSVVLDIIEEFCSEFRETMSLTDSEQFLGGIAIIPRFESGIFQFVYDVEGISVSNIGKIFIKTVSGKSSFIDFLLFKQENEPTSLDNPIMAIEETKTSDEESRNTGVYQRGSKFVFIKSYYPNVKMYMLYNDQRGGTKKSKPSDTSLFGTNILLTLGVKIIGKTTTGVFNKFNTVDELVDFKSKMRKAPKGNVPITIKKVGNRIEISGRLSKPVNQHNIGHDPNIGALSMIAACIRSLGWDNHIVITKHGVSQNYINSTGGKNKFLLICEEINIQLEGITLTKSIVKPKDYWVYEKKSEKMASILLHIQSELKGLTLVYENHAGCERGYFIDKNNNLQALPKKDKNGDNLYLPDLVLYDEIDNQVLLIEGKQLSTLSKGLQEIANYDSIENEYIKPSYKGSTIFRFLSIFGGVRKNNPHEKVLFYLSDDGHVIINKNAPSCILRVFNGTGVKIL